jgi:DNA-directed RNA polymerase specialized sigma24 family protein
VTLCFVEVFFNSKKNGLNSYLWKNSRRLKRLFNSIEEKKVLWLSVICKIISNDNYADDIYQNANIKILEALSIGKIELANIQDEQGNINYSYYYRIIQNAAVDHLREKQKEIIKLNDFRLNLQNASENTAINYDLVDEIIKVESNIVIDNSFKGVTLMDIAKRDNLPYKRIWDLKEETIYELRKKYKEKLHPST